MADSADRPWSRALTRTAGRPAGLGSGRTGACGRCLRPTCAGRGPPGTEQRREAPGAVPTGADLRTASSGRSLTKASACAGRAAPTGSGSSVPASSVRRWPGGPGACDDAGATSRSARRRAGAGVQAGPGNTGRAICLIRLQCSPIGHAGRTHGSRHRVAQPPAGRRRSAQPHGEERPGPCRLCVVTMKNALPRRCGHCSSCPTDRWNWDRGKEAVTRGVHGGDQHSDLLRRPTHSPRQQDTNENTNRLFAPAFPEGRRPVAMERRGDQHHGHRVEQSTAQDPRMEDRGRSPQRFIRSWTNKPVCCFDRLNRVSSSRSRMPGMRQDPTFPAESRSKSRTRY